MQVTKPGEITAFLGKRAKWSVPPCEAQAAQHQSSAPNPDTGQG